MSGLFSDLPHFPPALPDADLSLLSTLPEWPTTAEVIDEDRTTARRLERKGLIKISREKMDDIAARPTWFAGKLSACALREVQ